MHKTYGPNIDSAILFHDQADNILRETTIDVFQRKEQLEADGYAIERLLKKFRKDQTFADDSILDDVWQEHLQAMGILSKDEQQRKDAYSLAKARATKDELRVSGQSDAARFGYCKRRHCKNRKTQRLLLRGFCPDCRGVTVTQTIAEGGTFDATAPVCLSATKDQMKTSLIVTTKTQQIHKDVLKPTTEERKHKVLNAKKDNPQATQREIAALTKVSQKQVSRILLKHLQTAPDIDQIKAQ